MPVFAHTVDGRTQRVRGYETLKALLTGEDYQGKWVLLEVEPDVALGHICAVVNLDHVLRLVETSTDKAHWL